MNIRDRLLFGLTCEFDCSQQGCDGDEVSLASDTCMDCTFIGLKKCNVPFSAVPSTDAVVLKPPTPFNSPPARPSLSWAHSSL